jgi:arylsulfatase A-like enzyme
MNVEQLPKFTVQTSKTLRSKLCVAGVILATIFGSGNFCAAADESRRPNIIYIMTDDLGYGDLGCYGQKVVRTPNLDKMAAEGMRFTDHYSGHTVCRPSRLVLWTGQHVGHTGLTGNRPRSLTGMEQTVAQRLKQAGYATGGVGKWALGNVNEPSEINNAGHPNNNGFDYWFGYLNQSNAHNFYPPFLWENRKQVALPGNVIGDFPNGRERVSSVKTTYSHDKMTDAALGFIRGNHEKPFLLHVHWTIPHANNEAGRVHGDGMEVPDYGEYGSRSWPQPEKGFAAMVTRMDSDVGRIFALLKELEIDDNTAVFFTSDNGPHQEGGHQHEFFDSNGPLTGYKRSMHDGGIRVPLLVRWPGKVKAGTVSDHPSAFWDFMPTACEIAQLPQPDAFGADTERGCDGISYFPTLHGSGSEQPRHEYLYWASQEGATSVGMRMGKWKLVNYRTPKKRVAAKSQKQGSERNIGDDWRLYDLNVDIGEKNDVANAHPSVVRKMLDLLKSDGLL